MNEVFWYQTAVAILVVLFPVVWGWGNLRGYTQGLREGGDMLIDLLVRSGDLDKSFLGMKHNQK